MVKRLCGQWTPCKIGPENLHVCKKVAKKVIFMIELIMLPTAILQAMQMPDARLS